MKLQQRLAIAAAVLALFAAGLYWVRERNAAQRRLEAWEAQRVEEAIPAAWDQTFAWEKADLTLAEFAELVAAKSGLTIELDEAGIAPTRSKQVKQGRLRVQVISTPVGTAPLNPPSARTPRSSRASSDD